MNLINPNPRPNLYVSHQREARRLFLAPPPSVTEPARSFAATLAAIGILLCLTGVMMLLAQALHREAVILDAQQQARMYTPRVLNLPEP